MGSKKSGLSDCERMISVDYVMNSLFDTPCIYYSVGEIHRFRVCYKSFEECAVSLAS